MFNETNLKFDKQCIDWKAELDKIKFILLHKVDVNCIYSVWSLKDWIILQSELWISMTESKEYSNVCIYLSLEMYFWVCNCDLWCALGKCHKKRDYHDLH